MINYLDYILYQNFVNHQSTERVELSRAVVESAMPLTGWYAGYPVTHEMLQRLKWANEYKAQGKRYPRPRIRKSEAWQMRMRKKLEAKA